MLFIFSNYVKVFREELVNKFVYFDINFKEYLKHIKTRHSYHLVDPSP